MSHRIIDLQDWIQSPAGQYLLDWELKQLDEVVVDIFGYHALQMGLPELEALQANRMPHRWTATQDATQTSSAGVRRAAVCFDFSTIPFPANSLDLVILPHTLEWTSDPHATLREVERVLVPEGKVVICSLNPVSLWGFRHQRGQIYRMCNALSGYLPEHSKLISYWRLRDWLRLLSFEVEVGRFGCYRPALQSLQWLTRWKWLDRFGARFWPIFGAAYFVVAVKRVRGMRLLGQSWRATPALSAKTVSIARKG